LADPAVVYIVTRDATTAPLLMLDCNLLMSPKSAADVLSIHVRVSALQLQHHVCAVLMLVIWSLGEV
jgi:hypothetical protein